MTATQVEVVSGTTPQYAEDSPHTSGDYGTLLLAVRNDSDNDLTTTDLDYSPLGVDSTGRLRVRIATGGAGFTAGAIAPAGLKNTTGATVALGVAGTVYDGVDYRGIRTPGIFKTRADASITAASPAALWTPTTGKRFRLMGFQLSLSVAGQIILLDGSTEILRSPKLAAAGIWDVSAGLMNGYKAPAINTVLNIDVSATGTVGGSCWGTEEA